MLIKAECLLVFSSLCVGVCVVFLRTLGYSVKLTGKLGKLRLNSLAMLFFIFFASGAC